MPGRARRPVGSPARPRVPVVSDLHGGRIPRLYAWWRLFGEQGGRCTTCPGPAGVVDHDHHTSLVRGLLCYDCNHTEALQAREVALGMHRVDRCWFQDYWDTPPGRACG